MGKNLKTAGIALLLVALLALAVRLALAALETGGSAAPPSTGNIRKAERQLKQAAAKDEERFRQASEAENPPPPPGHGPNLSGYLRLARETWPLSGFCPWGIPAC